MSDETATATHRVRRRMAAIARGPPIATSSPHQLTAPSTAAVNKSLIQGSRHQKKDHEEKPQGEQR